MVMVSDTMILYLTCTNTTFLLSPCRCFISSLRRFSSYSKFSSDSKWVSFAIDDFMDCGFTSGGQESGSVFSAAVCQIQASKHYIESLKVKGSLCSCLLITCMSFGSTMLDIWKPSSSIYLFISKWSTLIPHSTSLPYRHFTIDRISGRWV